MKIISVFASNTRVALVCEKGQTIYYDQGTPEAHYVCTTVVPAINQYGAWEGEVDSTVAEKEYNNYVESSTLVKFFRIAKSKLQDFFNGAHEIEQVSESELDALCVSQDEPVVEKETQEPYEFCDPETMVTQEPEKPKRDLTKLQAVAELLDTTKKFKSSVKKTKESYSEDTVIAVVGDTVIEDVAKVEKYVSTKGANTQEALDNFFKRLAGVINSRKFSAQDLLTFLEKANLPLANDGSIIVYKALRQRDDVWVDIHSGTVKQKVGTLVYMDADKVDPDRNQDCSYGLHIASISYLNTFKGSHCFIVKVAPENVIAVPQYNVNKMRVSKYHILSLLSDEAYKTLCRVGSINDHPEDLANLNKAIEGKFPEPSSYNYLGNLGLHDYENLGCDAAYYGTPEDGVPSKEAPLTKPVVELNEEQEEEKPSAPVVDTTTLAKSLSKKTPAPKPKKAKQSMKDVIAKLLEGHTPSTLPKNVIVRINTIKKKQKKSYAKLGIPAEFHEVLKNG